MNARSTLGKRLQLAIDEEGISPAKLAADCETTDATVSNWLNDEVQVENVKGAMACRFATRLKVRVEWLLLNQPPMRNPGISAPTARMPNMVEKVDDLLFGQVMLAQKLAESIPTLGRAVEAAIVALPEEHRAHDHLSMMLARVRSELAKHDAAVLLGKVGTVPVPPPGPHQ